MHPCACPHAVDQAHFLHLLGLEGVEATRVDLLPLQAANTDHLSMYAFMDISLDPFPYAGESGLHTGGRRSLCHSLSLSVPSVTLILIF